jgi:hypothetical protein
VALARGLGIAEVIGLIVILAVLGAVVVVWPTECGYDHTRIDCLNNVKNLVGVMEAATAVEPDGLCLEWLLTRFATADGKTLELLFCPGDPRESLAKAGGVEVYRDRRGDLGRLTSYAVRDFRETACRASFVGSDPVVLMCDDSEDHHEGGFVVGMTSGAARWRDKVEDWGLAADAAVDVGPDSSVDELRCLRAD